MSDSWTGPLGHVQLVCSKPDEDVVTVTQRGTISVEIHLSHYAGQLTN